MRLLLDQGLPRSAAAMLCRQGVDTIHLGDIGRSKADDCDILEIGREQGRVVVALDADFHTLLALTRATAPSVIRIRIEGLRAEPLTRLLLDVLSQCAADLERGAAVTVQPGRIRVRLLPLVAPDRTNDAS